MWLILRAGFNHIFVINGSPGVGAIHEAAVEIVAGPAPAVCSASITIRPAVALVVREPLIFYGRGTGGWRQA